MKIAQTFDVAPKTGVSISIALTAGECGYAIVRDADRPEHSPLAHRALGAYYPQLILLRASRLKDARRLTVIVGAQDQVDVKVASVRAGLRLSHLATTIQDLLAGGWAAWRHGRNLRYALWHERFNRLAGADRAAFAAQVATLDLTGKIDVQVLGDDPIAIEISRASVLGAELHGAALRTSAALPDFGAAGQPTRPYCVLVQAGALVEPYAISLLVGWLAQRPDVVMVYADAEAPDLHGRITPLFTTRFDPVAAEWAPGRQINGIIAVRRQHVLERPSGLDPSASMEALAASVLAARGRVAHLPVVLSRLDEPPQPAATQTRTVAQAPGRETVSFIIPSRDNPAMLQRAVQSLHRTTTGIDVRFVIVDHASSAPQTARLLSQLQQEYPLDVVRAEGEFNFSRLMNIGRSRAVGDVLFSVNDDIEALNDGWLAPLLALLRESACGAVGPQLLFPDGRVQHAGVVVGLGGIAGHAGRLLQPGDVAATLYGSHTQQVSVVTGAVLGVRAAVWDRVGGWNPDLAIDFNDVDFCLQIAALGLRNVYCAQSILMHHESVSRRGPPSPERWRQMQHDHNEFLRLHWSSLARDPWYSANLTLKNTDLTPAFPPRRPPLRQILEFDGETTP